MSGTLQIELPLVCRISDILAKYGFSEDEYFSSHIGADNGIYIIVRKKSVITEHYLITVFADDESGEMFSSEVKRLYIDDDYIFEAEPMGDGYIVKSSPDKAMLLDSNGHIIKSLFIGEYTSYVKATADNRIVTAFFDQGVFENNGNGDIIGKCGLIVRDINGKQIFCSRREIYDCYAMYIDENSNIWYYYYDSFELTKLSADMRSEISYQTDIDGAKFLIVSSDGKRVIIDKGYDNQYEYALMNLENGSFVTRGNVEFYCGGKKVCCFESRASKVIIIKDGGLYCGKISF